jgi:hypothetical protein
VKSEKWTALFGEDPRPWLLESDEPAARWVALVELLDRPEDDAEVTEAHRKVLDDPGTKRLLDDLRPWDEEVKVSGHDKPNWPPNTLSILADMGVRAADDARIEAILSSMLEHQDEDGRFQAFGRWRGTDDPVWGAMLCDTHAITEVLARAGHAEHPAVERSLKAIEADLVETDLGRAWPCRTDPALGWRGPGRKGECCPQVGLEALRAFSYVPEERRPGWLAEVARASHAVWRARGERKPYMFGHGRKFKEVKWPATWYSALAFVDTLGRYPALWRDGDEDDRAALAEVAACLVAYTVAGDGTVTPLSCFKGYEELSIGQKKVPSGLATARVAVALRRLDDLAEEIQSVDVGSLGSSKGGDGTPLPPRA